MKKQSILVAGGAGYIGSHMTKCLVKAGYEVVVLDDLSAGDDNAGCYGELIKGDIGDSTLLDRLFAGREFACVMHFASFIEVAGSVREPEKYYRNNVFNTKVLLDAMLRHGVKNLIFSSTAALFGNPVRIPIDEEHPEEPINPYGRTKLMVEWMLRDYDHSYGLKSTCLRYFNAAGADPDGELGECHDPETHLIPLVLQAASGRRDSIAIFGTDYDTPDGTAIRDYIHVSDLCDAHLLAMERLLRGGDSARYNLGNGRGFSVREVIDAVQRVTGRDFTVREEARRPGDPPRLVADSARARGELGWQPRYQELERIIGDAWRFEQARLRSAAAD